jgi:hypothetical protein
MVGLALAWGELYTVVRRPDRRGVILAALLFVAAAYTRQTYALAAPPATFAWLLARGKWRRTLTLATLTGELGLLLQGILSGLTGGGFFFHIVSANANQFLWEQVSYHLSTLHGLMPLLLAEGLAFVILGIRFRPASWWVVGAYLAGSVATALLIGKIGPDLNYLLELSAALALAFGALISCYAPRPALLLPLDGRRIYLQPFEMTQLQRDGRWDQGPLLASIERRKFPAILIWKPSYASGVHRERWI